MADKIKGSLHDSSVMSEEEKEKKNSSKDDQFELDMPQKMKEHPCGKRKSVTLLLMIV